MQELLVGNDISHSADAASLESTPSVETFQGSPQSQVSPPVISDTQPAVLQPMTHQLQGVGNVMNHSSVPNAHTQPVNGFYQGPTAMPHRIFSGVFQPAMSSTPTAVDSAPSRFQVVNKHHGLRTSQPYVNGALGSQPVANHGSSYVGNGKFLSSDSMNELYHGDFYVLQCRGQIKSKYPQVPLPITKMPQEHQKKDVKMFSHMGSKK